MVRLPIQIYDLFAFLKPIFILYAAETETIAAEDTIKFRLYSVLVTKIQIK